MENQFDFYAFTVSAPRIGDLTRAGIDRKKIERRYDGWKRYGRNVYRRYCYVATIGYMDVPGSSREAVDEKIRQLTEKHGIMVHPQYIAID